MLLQRRGEVIDKDHLFRAVWPDTVVEENSLTRNISALRKALGEKPDSHRYVVIACFALAGKCGGFGASGFADAALASRDKRSINARPANPPPASHRISRRVRPHGV